MKSTTFRLTLALAAVSVLFANNAYAYLGGFEGVDGYRPFLNDVSTYNAGQHGPNAGGGVYMPLPPNTGLWKKLQGPLWPAPGTAGGVAYATGHANFDRTNPGGPDQALVITTNADGWSGGSQEYSYDVDSFDLGGINPNTTGGDVVNISFWSCSWIPGSGEGGGLGPGTIANTVSFYDSLGNLGFAVGGIQPGITTDFAATNVGSWVQSSVAVGTSSYHRWDISLDLNMQRVSIDVFEGATLTPLVTNAPLINPMSDLSELRFLSAPGENNAKVWALDDFTMGVRVVPEPSSILLAAMSLAGILLGHSPRRRKMTARKPTNSLRFREVVVEGSPAFPFSKV
jgi:PEP-CTERM motif